MRKYVWSSQNSWLLFPWGKTHSDVGQTVAETVCLSAKEIVPQRPEKVMCLIKLLPQNRTGLERKSELEETTEFKKH